MKKTFLSFVLLIGFSIISVAQGFSFVSKTLDGSGLGLADRKALKEYQEKTFPAMKKGITVAAGFDVPMDVKWEQIAAPGDAASYKDPQYWSSIIFQPLAEGLTSITSDEMGKEALKAKLKKIVIVFNPETGSYSYGSFTYGLSWEAGVLTINWRPACNADDDHFKDRTKAIVTFLEKKL